MSKHSSVLTQPKATANVTPAPSGILQRQCDCGAHTVAGGDCSECKNKEINLQRQANCDAPATVPPIVHEVLAATGQTLDSGIREFMESRFRHDFSGVRLHTDERAAKSARAVGAQAYAVGRNIVFGRGSYAPNTRSGRELLAHELTHVVQQASASGSLQGAGLEVDPSPSAEREAQEFATRVMSDAAPDQVPSAIPGGLQRLPLSLQRGGQDRCSGSGATCATGDECSTPDKAEDPGQGQSSGWTMTVNNDIERRSWYEALLNQEFGHTYVRFAENSGRQFTYGFYPAKDLPNENRQQVAGCVHHPDTTHDSCIDDRITYSLTQAQYDAALAMAQKLCKQPPLYGPDYTCTTYAQDLARAAGQSLPSSRSEPTTVFSQPVPSIDNPNTLHEGVEAERAKDPKKKGFWNTATPPTFRLKPVAPVKLSDDPTRTIFKLDWMPVEGVTYRWRLFDGDNRHYLLRGGEGSQDVLDWLSFTGNSTALIGRKTRDLLKERGVTRGSVQCTLRHPSWNDQSVTLALEFTS
jgi:hypothetical protein